MPRNKEETEGLSLLGNKKTVYKDTYAPEVLETFVNKQPIRELKQQSGIGILTLRVRHRQLFFRYCSN